MFALSKGNKRKWVNAIEMHCRMCYNLTSLDEHAQKTMSVCTYGRWLIQEICVFYRNMCGGAVCVCTCACCVVIPLRDMNSDR